MMYKLKRAFARDTLAIWSDYDYSDPDTIWIGNFVVGDEVEVLERKYPGVLVRWENGNIGWACDWNVEELMYVEHMRY